MKVSHYTCRAIAKQIKDAKNSLIVSFIFFTVFAACDTEKKSPEYSVDTFIAHAGGYVDGHVYTNSLEAMNFSYSQGCRMFELDLWKTTDNMFVGVHDWAGWKAMSNYPKDRNDTPVSLQEFLSLRIHGAYTPLHLPAIVDWFEKHPDAILVTDKLNTPKEFFELFPFKERLMMELFTWDAVYEALEIGVKAMPSENLIFETPNIEQVLDSLNISYIAISRRAVASNQTFLKTLKNKGVKTYVFHVNHDAGKDEKYVLENELEFITGMYADDVSFLLNAKK